MKYFSMFSGIGGFEYGIQNSRKSGESRQLERVCNQPNAKGNGQDEQYPSCVGYSEIDKYASAIYRYHFPNHKNFGDATRIIPSGIPDFDILVGGFPCQAFSIAGKRKGFDDTRGTLFFEIARVLTDKRPKYFLLENVKGLLSHDFGCTFRTILGVLADLGYFVEWQVLNSKDFGVPQNRERVFLVGHLGGISRQTVFPVGESDQADIGEVDRLHHSRPASALRATDYKGTHNVIRQLNNPTHSNDRLYGSDGLAPALNTAQGGNRQPKIIGGLQDHQTPREDGLSPTLTEAMGKGGGQIPVLLENQIRRLTPIECERLQGFPDNYTKYGLFDNEIKEISDTQRYKTLGNAVTTNVIETIIKKFKDTQ